MPVSGKYDFPGISKAGAIGLKAAFASTPWLSWINSLGSLSDYLLRFLTNWLANKGLIVVNLGAIFVEGHFDQQGFDSALDQGLKKVDAGKGKLTPKEVKAIDDEVIKAFRKFARVTGHNPLHDDADVRL